MCTQRGHCVRRGRPRQCAAIKCCACVRVIVMLQKLFSISVASKGDMAELEAVVVGLLGGEHGKCAFIRSQEFVKLRLHALYHRKHDPPRTSNIIVYGEGLKITLTPSGTACVFITDPCFEPIEPSAPNDADDISPSSLGKRPLRLWEARGAASSRDGGFGVNEPPP